MTFDLFWLEVIRAVAWPIAFYAAVRLLILAATKKTKDD